MRQLTLKESIDLILKARNNPAELHGHEVFRVNEALSIIALEYLEISGYIKKEK